MPSVIESHRHRAEEGIISVGQEPTIIVTSSREPDVWVSSQSPGPGTAVVDRRSKVTLQIRGGAQVKSYRDEVIAKTLYKSQMSSVSNQ